MQFSVQNSTHFPMINVAHSSGVVNGVSSYPDNPPPAMVADPQLSKYLCSVCKKILKEPMILGSSCDHNACKNCAKNVKKCSIDNFDIDQTTIVENKLLAEEINQLQINCRHKGNGCLWMGKLGALEDHMVACGYGPSIYSKHLVNHSVKFACPFGAFGCPWDGPVDQAERHGSIDYVMHLALLCKGLVNAQSGVDFLLSDQRSVTTHLDDFDTKAAHLTKLYGSQFLWRIDDFQKKFNDAKAGSKPTIFSQPFLTGRHGYKMAVSACLYGEGRGDFDALLPWPFSHRVTLTLVDQSPTPSSASTTPTVAQWHHVSYTLKPLTASNDEARAFLARPSTERNASFGAQAFCDLDVLTSESRYVQDDVAFVRVQVDTDDMPIL